MLREMGYWQARVPGAHITSIFFGGGTPSLMPPATVAALIDEAARLWGLNADCEITLEANPTSVEAANFAALAQAGVNRVSLGVQSLRPESLAFLGREHSAEEALAALALAARTFPRYSFDLIYALPNQTLAEWERELREALHYARGHLSLYQLTIEENTAFHHAYHVGKSFQLPEDSLAATLYQTTQDIMEAAGLPAYEISNHAEVGQESRHNLSYWQSRPYFGIGPGAHGRVEPRTTNHESRITRTATRTLKSPERWLAAVEVQGHGVEEETPLTPEEHLEEALLMGLRLREGVTLEGPLAPLRPRLTPAILTQLSGLVTLEGHHLRTTPRGRLLLNYVIQELLG